MLCTIDLHSPYEPPDCFAKCFVVKTDSNELLEYSLYQTLSNQETSSSVFRALDLVSMNVERSDWIHFWSHVTLRSKGPMNPCQSDITKTRIF